MKADAARRWVAERQFVEEYERRSAGPVPDPAVSWQQALSLFALVGRMVGWPVQPDEVRRREDAQAANAWRRLRARIGRPS